MLPCLPAVFIPTSYLLVGLQTLGIDPSYEVGLRADVIVSSVLDKVHVGIVCSLCSETGWCRTWQKEHSDNSVQVYL